MGCIVGSEAGVFCKNDRGERKKPWGRDRGVVSLAQKPGFSERTIEAKGRSPGVEIDGLYRWLRSRGFLKER